MRELRLFGALLGIAIADKYPGPPLRGVLVGFNVAAKSVWLLLLFGAFLGFALVGFALAGFLIADKFVRMAPFGAHLGFAFVAKNM